MWAAAVAVTGGIDARILGVDVRSRDPFRALAAGFAVLVIHAIVFRRELTLDLHRVAAVVRARAGSIVALLAIAVAAHGVVHGTFSVGGSDAYGYVNQAYDWSEGALPRPIRVPAVLPFESSDRLQAPLGYREGPEPRTIVPTYAPGLPLLMAAVLRFGACAPFLVVPFFAALFVWLTFRLGARAGGTTTGLVAAFMLSASPVVLYQSIWPMSDVPAGAVWTGAALYALGHRSRDAAAAGLFAAAGLLIRPNLLPVAAVLVLPLLLEGPFRVRVIRLGAFAAPIVPVVVFAGWLNALWFGSPLNSGYGAASELYEWANVVPNLALYGRWMWQAQTPWTLLAVLPLTPWARRSLDGRAVAACALLFVAVLACYVSYAQFEVWTYLRFLLPAFGGLMVLVAAGLLRAARAIPTPFGHLGGALVLWLLASASLTFAGQEGIFGRVRESERKYAAIGTFVAEALPGNAAVIAVQHAGSVRYYSGFLTVRFDALEPARSLELGPALERGGHHPFLVIDDAEMADVRRRFGFAAESPLPWPIRARMRELGGVSVYDLASAPSAGGPTALEPNAGRWCDVPRRAPARP